MVDSVVDSVVASVAVVLMVVVSAVVSLVVSFVPSVLVAVVSTVVSVAEVSFFDVSALQEQSPAAIDIAVITDKIFFNSMFISPFLIRSLIRNGENQ